MTLCDARKNELKGSLTLKLHTLSWNAIWALTLMNNKLHGCVYCPCLTVHVWDMVVHARFMSSVCYIPCVLIRVLSLVARLKDMKDRDTDLKAKIDSAKISASAKSSPQSPESGDAASPASTGQSVGWLGSGLEASRCNKTHIYHFVVPMSGPMMSFN